MKQSTSLHEYFHTAVRKALFNQKLDASEMAAAYLVRLLSEFVCMPLPEEALGLKMCEGLQGTARERVQKLKQVGDTSLFVSGYFPESLSTSLVDVDYYIGIGEVAYGSLANLVRGLGRSSQSSEVFRELSSKFPRFVDVLIEVSSDAGGRTPSDLLRLYEKYLKTRSDAVAAELRRRGFPVKTGPAN